MSFRASITAAQSEKWQRSEGKTADEIMLQLLPVAGRLASPPISDFKVGAVARGTSGALYLGANLEIPRQSLGFTVHAEQAAASNAYMHEEAGIAAIAVTSSPCGYCRQFLEEVSPGGEIVVLVKGQKPVELKSLLPAAFGPHQLGLTTGAFPIQRVKIALLEKTPDTLESAALAAACASYAPYTKAHSGIALRLSDGSMHSGSYIENAAFNPSLSPLQVALVAAVNAGRGYEQITDAVLVELENAAISQMVVTKAALASTCPKVRLRTAAGRLVA